MFNNSFATNCELTIIDMQTKEKKTFAVDPSKKFLPNFNPTEFKCVVDAAVVNKEYGSSTWQFGCFIQKSGVAVASSVILLKGERHGSSATLMLSDSKGKSANLLLTCKR